jgi:hypothetical protein
MAENLLGSILKAKLSRPTQVATFNEAAVPDRTKQRQKWVTENDSSVHRRYEDVDQRGSWRGYRGFFGIGRGGRSGGFKRGYKARVNSSKKMCLNV